MPEITKVVVANHKTGTMLMHGLLRDYCEQYGLKLLLFDRHLRENNERIDPTHDFQSYDFISINHARHFERLIDTAPAIRYRAVHLIRNPYEIVMSGVRYHQIAREEWSDKKLFVADQSGACGFRRIARNGAPPEDCVGEFSCRQVMEGLTDQQKIEFEIRDQRHSFNTIPLILKFLKRFEGNDDVATIRLEDISSDACIAFVFEFLELNPDFLAAYRRKVWSKAWLGRHVTNGRGGDTYSNAFTERLYEVFADEFGPHTLAAFGYAPPPDATSTLSGYEAHLARIGKSLRIEPSTCAVDLEAATGDVKALFALGERWLNEYRLSWAKAAFEACLELDGGRVATLAALARMHMLQPDHAAAIACYKRILEIAPTPPAFAHIGIGNACAATLRTAEAIMRFELAVPLVKDATALHKIIAKLRGETR